MNCSQIGGPMGGVSCDHASSTGLLEGDAGKVAEGRDGDRPVTFFQSQVSWDWPTRPGMTPALSRP